MAKTIMTTDDIDGSANAATIEFSFDGQSYTIDLAKKHRTAFEKALKPYIDAATAQPKRRTKTTTTARSRRQSSSPKQDLAAIRAWAAEQGMPVSSRGRIPGDVLDAYNAAH